VFYARTIRQCINRDERNSQVSKRQCIAEVCLPNDVGHGNLIRHFADEQTLLVMLINVLLFPVPTTTSTTDAPAIGHAAGRRCIAVMDINSIIMRLQPSP
jgi:hypothetical protein